MNKDGYLEFMAPGVVISISYVMATGLTALAFILERRDGLLERSLVSGVQTSQILLAHAINQVVVMMIQIFLVLGCTFFIFEIPSRGPFPWVVLLILLQGCTGMGFGKSIDSFEITLRSLYDRSHTKSTNIRCIVVRFTCFRNLQGGKYSSHDGCRYLLY